jgi:predicted HicB family RNase H-like nuclease
MDKNRNFGGRPPKGDRTQAARLYLRADDDEKARYDEAAVKAGLSLSEWIRDRLNRAARRELK